MVGSNHRKLCMVMTSTLQLRFFMMPHLAALSRDHEVSLIVSPDDEVFLRKLDLPIRVTPLQIERKVAPWQDLKVLLRLYWIFRQSGFDLVHTVTPKAGLLGILAAWAARVPVRLHTFQGEVWVAKRGLWRQFLKFLDWLVARFSTHLTVVSFSEQRFLVNEGVIQESKSVVLGQGSISGVDLARFKPDALARQAVREEFGVGELDVLFLYVGRLNEDKGLLELAEAFVKVANVCLAARLLVVGPDEEGMHGKMRAHLGEISRCVRFAPFTSQPERYMAAADVLVLPSHREGFGVVVIEAAGVGIPAIGSRIYGIEDAIQDEVTGLLFAVGDVDDLARQMQRLAVDASLRGALGGQARQRVQSSFSQASLVAAMCGFYDSLLTANSRT